MFSKGEHSEENKIIPRDEFEIQIRLDSVPLTRFTPSERRY